MIVFDDALFLHQENSSQRQFQVLMGEISIDPKNEVNFQKNMTHNMKIAKRDKFAYKHIIFPSKPMIYSESFKDIGVNLNSVFTEGFYHPEVIYPQLGVEDYHLHDTHINDIGSFKVVSKVLEDIGYPLLPEPNYLNKKKHGDLMKMLGNDSLENIKVINGFKKMPFEPKEYNLNSALKGNTGDIKFLFNKDSLYNRRLVLFGDSFFEFSLRVYSLIFNEVIYLRNPYILDDIVRILQPDIVFTANTERYLFSVPDSERDKPWFMNYFSKKFNSNLLGEEDRRAFESIFSGRHSKLYKEFLNNLHDS